MGKIYCLIGKSASGKDSIYREVINKKPDIKRIIQYTTRPIRENERNGVEYNYVSNEKKDELIQAGRVIEKRTYKTVHGEWTYFTVDDGMVQLEVNDYLLIATIESFSAIKSYYGDENVVPIYIELDDGVRLERAIMRERMQANPCYEEVCRRFMVDQSDFSDSNLKANKINYKFVNDSLEKVSLEIVDFISKKI